MLPSFVPRWTQDLVRYLPLKPSFVLTGNVTDYQIVDFDGAPVAMSMPDALVELLGRHGYAQVLVADPAYGFSTLPPDAADLADKLGLPPTDESGGLRPADLTAILRRFLALREDAPVALVVNFAGRTVQRVDSLDPAEHRLFTTAQIGGHRAMPRAYPSRDGRAFHNTVTWVTDSPSHLPDWFIVNNPSLREIPVAVPDAMARRALAPGLLCGFGANPAPETVDAFVDGTDGMLLRDLESIVRLGMTEGLDQARIADAVRHFKTGVIEDPWRRIDRRKIHGAEAFIRRRVQGQDSAVIHMLDLIKRAVIGADGSRRGGRPRGFALFAGPTGVGKTELAKTITQLLFGDENSYIRFDMSEFGTEHADQRLIGAPPGYVGYDQGGQLTNAIRERPHAVVLFDEIEKAHPKLLNLFLQILDDGVLTSGRGDRVYFSEAVIIFTSNLGITRETGVGQREATVTASDPYDVVERKVRAEIEHFFKFTLGRPEILNRFGENIIVFDFIRPAVADRIFDAMVEAILAAWRDDDYPITLDPEPAARLRALCLEDLSNGGRGIRNQLEAHLVNPMSRALFDADVRRGNALRVTDIRTDAVTEITLAEDQAPDPRAGAAAS